VQVKITLRPPYPLDLAPPDFGLFGDIKHIAGQKVVYAGDLFEARR
jgi:hypothetical protein